jgi:hypothetical protein
LYTGSDQRIANLIYGQLQLVRELAAHAQSHQGCEFLESVRRIKEDALIETGACEPREVPHRRVGSRQE